MLKCMCANKDYPLILVEKYIGIYIMTSITTHVHGTNWRKTNQRLYVIFDPIIMEVRYQCFEEKKMKIWATVYYY